MKSYPSIISKLFYEPLVLTRAKHAAIWRVLDARLNGEPRAEERDDDEREEDFDWMCDPPNAVIPVYGILGKHLSQLEMSSGGADVDKVSNKIDAAINAPGVERIIFDFRSPGGAVTGIPELARKIANINSKETVAFTDSECCSGALWLASQCRHFYAAESSSVGSIGVWCAYLDISRQLANEGANVQEFSAGKYKTMGAYWRPLSAEEADMIQASVDKVYSQFKDAITSRREVADKFMQGQVFDGAEAIEAGLVDGLVDSIDELLD